MVVNKIECKSHEKLIWYRIEPYLYLSNVLLKQNFSETSVEDFCIGAIVLV